MQQIQIIHFIINPNTIQQSSTDFVLQFKLQMKGAITKQIWSCILTVLKAVSSKYHQQTLRYQVLYLTHKLIDLILE